MKILVSAILLLAFGYSVKSQSIIGITGGYTYTYYHSKNQSAHFEGTFDSEPSYSLTACLKGREAKPIHLGFEASYVNKKLDMKASYGGMTRMRECENEKQRAQPFGRTQCSEQSKFVKNAII